MDATLVIMFAAVIVMTTALSFMELRRIRKALDRQNSLREKQAPVEAMR